jgi:hypothetical protein
MAELLGNRLFTALDADGKPISGARLSVFLSGTTTPAAVYQDAALTTPHASPVICDSAGRAPDIYFAGDALLKVNIRDADDVEIRTIDPFNSALSAGDLTFEQLGTGAVLRTVESKLEERVTVLDRVPVAMASAIVAKNSTVNVQAYAQQAVDTAGDNSHVDWTEGQYYLASTVTIGNDRFKLRGDGPYASRIRFAPTADDVALEVTKGASPVYAAHISGLGFKSTVSAYAQTAIKLNDVKGCVVEDIVINDGDWPGVGSTFLRFAGRDTAEVRNVRASTNRPLVLGPNPNSTALTADHFHIHMAELICDLSTGKCIEMEDGFVFTNSTFGPALALVGGKYGMYRHDTTSVIAPYCVEIIGLRTEQGTDATGWSYYDDSTHLAVQNWTMRNSHLDPARNGVYLRDHLRITFDSVNFTSSTKEHVNITGIQGTVVIFRNCYFEPGGTKTMTNLRRVEALMPQYQSASTLSEYEVWVYDDGTVSDQTPIIRNNVKIWEYEFSIVNNGVLTTPCNSLGKGATIMVTGAVHSGIGSFTSAGATTKIGGTANFSVTNAAGNLCFTDLGGGVVGLINNATGITCVGTITVMWGV